MSARIPLIFGTAAFGLENTHATRIHDLPTCQEVLDAFVQKAGYKELDTARGYGHGSSEQFLSKLNIHGAVLDTKCFPANPGDHEPEKLRASLQASIKALGGHKIRIFYLHAPDRATSFERTCEEVNKLHSEGLFEEFGLSNYYSWEVAQIYTICKERGYVLPTVYQGSYNLISRSNEDECGSFNYLSKLRRFIKYSRLFPCLHTFNIRFIAFNPLAGGLLAGTLKSKDDIGETGGRFDVNHPLGKRYRERYIHDRQFEALGILSKAADKHGLTTAEIALRWLQHHSAMTPNDRIILGASKVQQVIDNVASSEKGPLPDDVVEAAEQAWLHVKPQAMIYAMGKKFT